MQQATYTNLPHGNYTFHVKAYAEGEKISEIQSVQFKILAPFWLTLPFMLASFLLTVTLLILTIRFFIVRSTRKSEEERLLIKELLHREQQQVKMQERMLKLHEKNHKIELHSAWVEGHNHMTREMFSGASHDLRQPLQALVIYIYALREIANDQQLKLIDKAESATRSMQHLIDDYLDESVLDSHIDHVQRSPVHLKLIFENLISEFDAIASDKNLKLRVQVRDLIVYSDASMLERIIRNLLSNAIRYTSKGGILLAGIKRGDEVCIEVWDTGRGIKEDALENVFKRFYQVESDFKGRESGYGLGLSIVKRFSETLGHKIEVKSKDGSGSMFRIRLPLYTPQQFPSKQVPSKQVEADVPLEAPLHLSGGQIRILLIDDEPLVREALCTQIQNWNMNVSAFQSITEMEHLSLIHI